MDISDRIKQVRGGMRQADFAAKVGVPKNTVGRWERGEQIPGHDDLCRILEVFTDINPLWFLLDDGPMRRELRYHEAPLGLRAEEGALDDEYINIPRYEVAASAGGGAVVHSEQVVDYLSFRSEWVRNTLGVSVRDLALISVIGDSMEPTLSEGDVVLLDMTTKSVLDGSIYALQLNGGLLVKRIQRRLDGSVVVKSDNPRYDQEEVSEDKADRLKIIGRVVWVGRRL